MWTLALWKIAIEIAPLVTSPLFACASGPPGGELCDSAFAAGSQPTLLETTSRDCSVVAVSVLTISDEVQYRGPEPKLG